MSLSVTDGRRLIEQDLYNELRWMLVAVSEWKVCDDARKNNTRLQGAPNHLQVVTMDSACVHIRSLYEFFIDIPGKPPRNDTAHANRDFSVSLAPTQLHKDYIESLNKRLFHVDNFRPLPISKYGISVNTDLNERVADLAQDVLTIWDKFVKQLPNYKLELSSVRERSIADAERAALSIGGKAVFS